MSLPSIQSHKQQKKAVRTKSGLAYRLVKQEGNPRLQVKSGNSISKAILYLENALIDKFNTLEKIFNQAEYWTLLMRIIAPQF
jgi:hypothetical protein